jgi:phenylacetate-CoA ligase
MILLFYPAVKAPGLTFYYITKSIIEDDGNVRIYDQANQNRYFEIKYVSDVF